MKRVICNVKVILSLIKLDEVYKNEIILFKIFKIYE